MAVPTVNVTCTVTNQTGAVVAGATVTAQLTGIDLYGTNYIFPSIQTFVTDINGIVTMPLFPNALGARRTAYQFIAIDPVTGRALINITAVVPNQNIDLSVLDAINKLPAYAPPLTQPFSGVLTSLASSGALFSMSQLVPAADQMMYFSGPNTALLASLTAFGRSLVAAANAAAAATVLGLGTGNSPTFAGLTITNSVITPLITTSGAGVALQLGANGASYWTIDTVANFRPQGSGGLSNQLDLGDVTNKIRTGYFGTSVVTPLMGTDTDVRLNVKVGGTNRWIFGASGDGYAITPNVDNAYDIGQSAVQVRTGYFKTNVVTPLVQSPAATDLQLSPAGGSGWLAKNSTQHLFPNGDNDRDAGGPSNRIAHVFTPIIDTGTTGSLLLKTNNGTTQVSIDHTASAVNTLNLSGAPTGQAVTIDARGTDANPVLQLRTKGTGTIEFRSDVLVTNVPQFQVLHTAASNRWPTATGSNGGNPQIGTNNGGLDFMPGTVRFPSIGTTANAANATLNAVGSNDLLRSTSSKRYKTEIEVLSRDEALTLLRKLNPITYASMSEHDDPYLRHTGFIAEEVFDINPLFVSLSKSAAGKSRPESVQYERLTVPLVAGWQDHEARLAALEARIH